jgi:hypothetical protein
MFNLRGLRYTFGTNEQLKEIVWERKKGMASWKT